MLQVITNCYYLAVQENLEVFWTGMVLLWTHNRCKNCNPNDSFTCKSIILVVHCQICKIYICTPLIGNVVLVSYFVYGPFLTVYYSNCVSLMSVQQRTHYLFILLRKYKNSNLSQTRGIVTTPVIQYDVVKNDYPEVHHSFYKIGLNLGQ